MLLKEKAEDLFRPAYMKDKLFNMLKQKGEFIRVDSQLGFLYNIPIGESNGTEIVLEVALQSGKQIKILNAYVGQQQVII